MLPVRDVEETHIARGPTERLPGFEVCRGITCVAVLGVKLDWNVSIHGHRQDEEELLEVVRSKRSKSKSGQDLRN